MRAAIADTIVPFDLRVPAGRITGGELRSMDLGPARLVCWADAFSDGEVARTSRLIRRSDPELCKIDVQLRGHAVLESRGTGRLGEEQVLPMATRQRALVMRIHAFIENRLADPALSPPVIAAEHHVSVRHLYNVFQPEGMSVAGWVRHRRLERCRRDLLDPLLRDRSVGAIAARWGFTDPSSFNRAFRSAYGVTPGEYRGQCS